MANPSKNVSPGTKGAIKELMVSVDLMNKGYQVFRAFSPQAPCDLIALKDGKCLRVEVTTGHLYKCGGEDKLGWDRHNPENYDVIVVILGDTLFYMPELV